MLISGPEYAKIDLATQTDLGAFLLSSNNAIAPSEYSFWAKRPVLSDSRPAVCVAAMADNTGRFAMKIKRYCQNCGKEFLEIPSRVKSGRGKYCSRDCQYSTTTEDRFWSLTNKNGPIHPVLKTRCWVFKKTRNGYGMVWDGSKGQLLAHRFSWEIHNGPIPKGKTPHDNCILHRCDNPACVRPDHLFLGTQSENVRDMWRKGRKSVDGDKNPAAKLTRKDIKEIRRLYGKRGKGGLTLTQLSERYGVSFSSIHRIVTNQTWKEVMK